jgi:two-component system NtrC family sensor kinase
VTLRIPASLKLTVPLMLLGFAAILSTVNVLYHVPRAEREAVEDDRIRVAQDMSRLQSTLEYLLLKGDLSAAQHEVAVLSHNHDITVAVLTDDGNKVIAATRMAWLDRPIADVLPMFSLEQAGDAIRERRARVTVNDRGDALLAYAGILMGREGDQLRPSRSGSLFMAYDLKRPLGDARAQVIQQSIYWAGWVVALAMVLWLGLHFLLTRRTARLVRAAEQLTAGDLGARSGLDGPDELGRLGRAFDSMALAIANDIAERERADEALRVSEASYRAIFDAAEDAIFVHDIDTGAIVDVNPKATATFGYTREEFRQIDVGRLGTDERPYTQQDAMEVIARAAAGERVHIEWHGKSKDGSLRWHEVFVKRVTIGGQDRVLALARDITEKKRSAEELARQRETLHQREKLAALGSLLAGVAHELNNPLSVVVARAVMLEEQGDPAAAAVAVKIRTAAERCARIVRTFVGMARQQRPARGAVAINDVVTAALDITAYSIRTSSIEVALDLSSDIPLILADADQLHQVLLNLLVNAQQALQDQRTLRCVRVTSRFDAAAQQVCVTVADNGPGVPEHLRTRVFEPYFTTKPTGIGTGVGLAVSVGIVEAHGGTLTLDCPPGGGTVFSIRLPVGKVDAPPEEASITVPISALRRKVLIVDDEADIRETLAQILTSVHHRVVAVGSGREALERLAAESYDVILTDMRMPDLDGRALYQEIERRWPHQAEHVVFVTGDTLSSALRSFVSQSGRRVIEKPFLPADVRRIVAEPVTGSEHDTPA